MRRSIQSIAVMMITAAFLCLPSPSEATSLREQEWLVRKQFVSILEAARAGGPIEANCTSAFQAPFLAWARSKPQILTSAFQRSADGAATVLCLTEMADNVVRMVIVRRDASGRFDQFSRLPPGASLDVSGWVTADAIMIWRVGIKGSEYRTARLATGGQPTTEQLQRCELEVPPQAFQSAGYADRASLMAVGRQYLQGVSDLGAQIDAMTGVNPYPPEHLMARLLVTSPDVAAHLHGEVVGAYGTYETVEGRREFHLRVWSARPGAIPEPEDFIVVRPTDRWLRQLPWPQRKGNMRRTRLVRVSAYWQSPVAQPKPLGDQEVAKAQSLYQLWGGLDGAERHRIQLDVERKPDGSPRWEGQTVEAVVADVKAIKAAGQVEWIGLSHDVLGIWSQGTPETVSLWHWQEVNGRNLLRTREVWVVEGDQLERLAHRLCVLPAHPAAAPTGGTHQLLSLKQMAGTPVGQLVTRLLRMAGLNNRAETASYLADSLAERVLDAAWWASGFGQLAGLDEADVLVDWDEADRVTVHCGQLATLTARYDPKRRWLTVTKLSRPSQEGRR